MVGVYRCSASAATSATITGARTIARPTTNTSAGPTARLTASASARARTTVWPATRASAATTRSRFTSALRERSPVQVMQHHT